MRDSVLISSKENAYIKHCQKLLTSKKERYADGLFVLEGLRLVVDAMTSGAPVRQLLLTERAVQQQEVFGAAGLLAQADLKGIRTLVLSNELGAKIAATEQTQGVFAVCAFLEEPSPATRLLKNGHYLVLVGLQDPGNLGMILRTADATGLDGVFLCGCCDLYSPKVVRATMGSLFRVPFWRGLSAEETLLLLRENDISSYAAVIDKTAKDLRRCDFSGGAAVCIGNEGNGLPPDIAAACDTPVTIQMHGTVNSLNAAMAAGIFLWELQGGRSHE